MPEIDPRAFFAAYFHKNAEINIPSVVQKLLQGGVLGGAGAVALHTAYNAGRRRTGEVIPEDQQLKEQVAALARGAATGTLVLGGGDLAWQVAKTWLERRKARNNVIA